VNVVDLVEWQTTPIRGALGEHVARRVHGAHPRSFDVGAPSVLAGPHWTVRSTGLIGYLPLDRDHALRIAPKVPIACVLAMLELAYDLPSLAWHAGLATHDAVDGLFETLALVLARKVADRVRKGLHRAYVEERDELGAARGRILPRETLARTVRGATGLVCDFETLTDDLLDNQILLWTLDRLRRSPLGRADVQREVRASHRLLAACLSLVPVRLEDCARSYDQRNADYRALHALCHLLLTACGATTAPGAIESVPFTVFMPALFERFVARWLARTLARVHVDAHVGLPLAAGLTYDVDLVVRERPGGQALAVLDTKYKDHTTPSADDVQQVVFYATVLGCREALLVYPRVVHPLVVQAGPVTVRTLGVDLSGLPAMDTGPFHAWADRFVASAAPGVIPT
jgi:5-methylcytosine-specific restriction enzyme subunit McrC